MKQFKVVITDYCHQSLEIENSILSGINAEFLSYHCKTEDEVIEVSKDADAVMVQYAPITRKVISNLNKCKIIARYAVGVDNIDVDAATEYGICVANVPDYGIDDISDHAILLMLAIARKVVLLNNTVKSGIWDYKVSVPIHRLKGRRLGLVGLGRIARMVAQKARCFGLEIYAYDPFVTSEIAKQCNVELVDFDTLIMESDFISIHVPLTEDTENLFNTDVFKSMKNAPYIINTGRGPIINSDDLIEALDKGYISGAALDVTSPEPINTDSPLLKRDNVIITPHCAWYSEEGESALKRMVTEEVVRVLSGSYPRNLVNMSVKEKNNLRMKNL